MKARAERSAPLQTETLPDDQYELGTPAGHSALAPGMLLYLTLHSCQNRGMHFPMPNYPCEVEIPDAWLADAGMGSFTPCTTGFRSTSSAALVPIRTAPEL